MSGEMAVIDIKSELGESLEESIKVNVTDELLVVSTSPESVGRAKKRRKVNRTGFPMAKKKRKKPQFGLLAVSSPSATSLDIPSSSTEAEDSTTLLEQKKSIVKILEPSPLPVVVKSGESGRKSRKPEKTQFSSTLTERVKTARRRVSVDNASKADDEKLLKSLGISTAFLNIVNPPVLLAEKTNYLVAGVYSAHYKSSNPEDKESLRNSFKTTALPWITDPDPATTNGLFQKQNYELPYDIWVLGAIRAREKLEEAKKKRQEERKLQATEEHKRIVKTETDGELSFTKLKKPRLPTEFPASWKYKKIKLSKLIL